MKKSNSGHAHVFLVGIVLFSLIGLIGYTFLRSTSAASVIPIETGPIFNDPMGVPDEQYKIVNTVNYMLDKAAPKSTARISNMEFELDSTANSVINAYKRGVNVKIAINGSGYKSPQVARVKSIIGSDSSKSSWIITCKNSCHTNYNSGVLHSKLFLFSNTAGKTNVAVFSSLNLNTNQSEKIWNDAYMIVGHDAIYNDAVTFFNQFRLDTTTPFKAKDENKNYAVYSFPLPKQDINSDYFTELFANTKCTGNLTTGIAGRTVVRLSVSLWQDDRIDLVNKLSHLKQSGCDIEVAIYRDASDPLVLQKLYDAGITTRFFTNDPGHYHPHSKFMIINGTHYGNEVKTVYTGSLNPSFNSTDRSDNSMIQIKNDPVTYELYNARFEQMWAQGIDLNLETVTQATSRTAADTSDE